MTTHALSYRGHVYVTHEKVEELKLHQLTEPISLNDESWILDNVMRDMKRGGIRFALVKIGRQVEVWRAASPVQSL